METKKSADFQSADGVVGDSSTSHRSHIPRRAKNARSESKAYRCREDFADDRNWTEYLKSLSPQEAYEAFVFSLSPTEREEAERLSKRNELRGGARVIKYAGPNTPSYAVEYDDGRPGLSNPERVNSASRAIAPALNLGPLSDVLRGVIAVILESGNYPLAIWALALHTGLAAQLGYQTASEVAERIGVPRQNLRHWEKKWRRLLGAGTVRASEAATQAARKRPSWRKKAVAELF